MAQTDTSPATPSGTPSGAKSKSPLRMLVLPVAIVLVLIAMALDTTVIHIGSEEDVRAAEFSAEAFGEAEFPRIQSAIETDAVDAVTLLAAIEEDRDAATERYGEAGSLGPVFPVYFSGVVGEGRSGVFPVSVEGIPEDLLIRVQFGPAINGTEVRDATGTIAFGDFTNQIEYQDAGSALNNQVKELVFADLDRDSLTGRTVSIVGVFRLVNPASWFVTPVRLELE